MFAAAKALPEERLDWKTGSRGPVGIGSTAGGGDGDAVF